jgi:hypothetical protein
MQNAESDDKRVFARFPVQLSIKFIDLILNKESQAQAKDISAKGIGFLADKQLEPLTPLEMWVQVPDKGAPFYTRGEVVWSEMVAPNQYRTGVNLERADLMGMSRILRNLRT